MSARGNKPAGAPAWIVTFADLVTLLLALFVLLLTFAELNVERYKQIAGSMREAFGLQSIVRLAGVFELDGSPQREHARHVMALPIPVAPTADDENRTEEPNASEKSVLQEIGIGPQREVPESPVFQRLKQVMAVEVADSVAELEQRDGAIIIRFRNNFAFPLGSRDLSGPILLAPDKLGAILEKTEGQIVVAGHTDDSPIANERFRSNWDLSTARAVSVVHYWLGTRIGPDRLSAEGHADSRPRGPNDSPENRAINRRVEVSIREQ